MGQKVHPIAFRILNGKSWRSNWFATKKKFSEKLRQDVIIKKLVNSNFDNAGIADINIQRASDQIQVTIQTSRPGVIIGKSGESIDVFKALLEKKLQTKEVQVKVEEIKQVDTVAALIADSIARQISKRIPYRRAVKQALDKAMQSGVKGCKIKASGRLNGAEIARTETYKKGNIPLHTIRANVDYDSRGAQTTYGVIGIKVWVYA